MTRRTGGREDGLLHLFTAWANGAVIVAGTGAWPMCSAPPSDARVVRECPTCPTWLIGDTEMETDGRLAEHRRRRHG